MDGPAMEGTCAFRFMPTDDLHEELSSAQELALGATQLALYYTWTHPADGPQRGLLVIGGPGEDAEPIMASWTDTWHQQPGLMILTGETDGDRVTLQATYSGDWAWQIDVSGVGTDELTMIMRNVIPESALADMPPDAPPMSAGPYDVMVARWRRPAP